MKSREKISLAVFLLIALCLAHAINSPSAGHPSIVQISESNTSSCPTCGTGYDIHLTHANYCKLPSTTTSPRN
jgi:hypothetical protein